MTVRFCFKLDSDKFRQVLTLTHELPCMVKESGKQRVLVSLGQHYAAASLCCWVTYVNNVYITAIICNKCELVTVLFQNINKIKTHGMELL